jgi:hypothetical protein
MRKLEHWFRNNKFMINIEKTSAMSYHTTQNEDPMRPKITLLLLLNCKWADTQWQGSRKWEYIDIQTTEESG